MTSISGNGATAVTTGHSIGTRVRRTGWRTRTTLVLAFAGAALVVTAGPAEAQLSGVAVSVSPALDSPVTVGDQNRTGIIAMTNLSFGTLGSAPVTVSNIRFNPSCATSQTGIPEPCPTPEPRPNPGFPIFAIDQIAVGRAGTACAGIVFTVSSPNANGTVNLTPSSPVVLGAANAGGPSATCIIDFTFDVGQRPSDGQTVAVTAIDATAPGAPGAATMTGSSGPVTVNHATPTIATTAIPSSASVGTPLQDSASLGGPGSITGTVTFRLFSDGACTTEVFTSTNPVDGTVATSGAFVPIQGGTYHWVATYNGDVNNNPAGPTPCLDPAEQVVVGNVVTTPPGKPLLGDFDGDGLTDVAVWRPANGTWYVRGFSETVWGEAGDVPVPADYAGDARTEIAVFRPSNGTWYIRGVSVTVWGQPGDIPVPADYNGDGKADIAVFRPSNATWYVRGITEVHYGLPGDVPVPADYAGDAAADIAVWRPSNGTWYVQGRFEAVWGQEGDIPVPANYGGPDAKADLAVYRPANGTWYVRGISEVHYGLPGDTPVPGDYNGGTTDIAVWRPSNGTWFLKDIAQYVWGQPDDIPV